MLSFFSVIHQKTPHYAPAIHMITASFNVSMDTVMFALKSDVQVANQKVGDN